MFGSFLNNEWGYWVVALLVRYAELHNPQTAVVEVGVSDAKAQHVAA
jgi:hypothetical protein